MTDATMHFVLGAIAGVSFGLAGGLVINGFWGWSLAAVGAGLVAGLLSWFIARESR